MSIVNSVSVFLKLICTRFKKRILRKNRQEEGEKEKEKFQTVSREKNNKTEKKEEKFNSKKPKKVQKIQKKIQKKSGENTICNFSFVKERMLIWISISGK